MVVQEDKMTETKKPKCKLTGTDGNIFALAGKASATLKKAGLHDEIKTMTQRIFASHSYGEALNIIGDYVEVS